MTEARIDHITLQATVVAMVKDAGVRAAGRYSAQGVHRYRPETATLTFQREPGGPWEFWVAGLAGPAIRGDGQPFRGGETGNESSASSDSARSASPTSQTGARSRNSSVSVNLDAPNA